MKLLIIAILSFSTAFAQAEEVFTLVCSVSHPVEVSTGEWERVTVAKESKVLEASFEEKKIELKFDADGEEVTVQGRGFMREVVEGLRIVSVITKTEIPSRNLTLLDHDGMQEVVTQTQGGIAQSGTTIYLGKDNKDPYSISCGITYNRN